MILCSKLSKYLPASTRINNCAAKTVLIRGVPNMALPIFSIKGTSPLTLNPDPEKRSGMAIPSQPRSTISFQTFRS